MNVLIVEDEFITSMAIKQAIEEELGYKVKTTSTGEETIFLCEKWFPDLVLLDIGLPGEMNGFDIAEIIKTQKDMPIIFMSGYSDQKTINRASNFTNSQILSKPLNESRLIQKIKSLLV